MNKDITLIVINKILELIPSHIKSIDYLSELLDISKDSAHRRLRGKMPFSFKELVILSEKLNFSLDELVALKTDNNKVVIELKVDSNPEQEFIEKIKKYKEDVKNRFQDKSSSSILALNYLPPELCIHFRHLFKFSYYTWLHWKDKSLCSPKFSEVEIPSYLENLRIEIASLSKHLKNSTFILDPNVFLTPIKLVLYFYNLELISKEEKEMIKEDFQEIINYIEKEVRINGEHYETKNYYYLSYLNIDVNNGYYIHSGNISSSFSFNFFNRIIIAKREICEAHKEWFHSLKKYSILITGSNEIDLAGYIKKQREYIDYL